MSIMHYYAYIFGNYPLFMAFFVTIDHDCLTFLYTLIMITY